MVGLDTNILLYAYDKNSLFYEQAKAFIKTLLGQEIIALADLTLLEFYSVITDGRKIASPMLPSEAAVIINNIINAEEFRIFYGNKTIIENLTTCAVNFNISRYGINDIYIANTLAKSQIKKIFTVNTEDFNKFDFIDAVNPFTTSQTIQSNQTRTIPYGRQSINEKDVAAVCTVLRSDYLTQGPKIKEFEDAVAKYCGAKYAVAVSSGTAALHLACLAAGLGEGDTLWTSPNTFVASANCALYCGAKPDFVDIDPLTYNISINALEEKLCEAKKNDSLPKVVIPVHIAGQSCDMEQIYCLGKDYSFTIIEDACHAIGGRYKGRKIGSCEFSDLTVFSFHPVKIITTGEGGMVLTNKEDLYQKLMRLRTHGITRDTQFMEDESDGPWYYQQIELGMNYRMTDIQAALGLSQLDRIDEFVVRRRELAHRYHELLSDFPLTIPWQNTDVHSAFHIYVVLLKLDKIKKTRREVFEELREKGIGVNVHYIPVHIQPHYRRLGFSYGQFPEAEMYYEKAITIPLYPSMAENEQDYVVEALREVLY